ncbi:serine/threonine protein kinase [Aldersonia sp. NBC_00410]|uniref:serine/threonine-protein kinase n=1 Tax=Aldersonia sp. NBC_00410 TaxID=2975954 RepID=UPI0022544B20|nr:serine/threonine-protein kinase [Aldersonia sp. NBC_00410]MCX5044973.1 serine/threonine protein kinase [Aldersonia sp. NBC_00410]
MDDESPAERVGSRVGNYQLRELLGTGRLGTVYEAGDVATEQVVAVKLMSPDLAADPAYRGQFHRANDIAARLPEPHVVPIHDWGAIGDDVLFLEMERVEGHDLRRLLATQGPMSVEQAVAAIEQVATALDAAHAAGLVHGDVKPANLLLTRSGFWQVTDFGLLPDGSGASTGTPAYPPPEYTPGAAATPSADVYALACVLHEAITGKPPGPASPAGGTSAFGQVIERGVATAPGDRFPTAGDFARAARHALPAPSASVPPPPPPPPPPMEPEPHAWSAAPEPPTAAWPPSPPPQSQPPVYAEPPRRRSVVFPVLIGALVVALLALTGVVVWLLFTGTNNDNDNTAQTTTTQSAQPNRATATAPTPSSAPPAALPAGATPCAGSGGGALTKSAIGNTVTSCPFAEEVRNAYNAGGPPSSQPRQVVAISPVTGQSYTMSCAPSGRLVTCTGGNGAVVHLY